MKTKITYLLIFTAAALASSCRKDKPEEPNELPKVTKGLFILNEGGFNASNSSIDYFDYASQKNNKNAYAAANGATKWDVGNDIQTYGSKVYAVINNSNLLVIADAKSLKSTASVTILQPRYIAFYKGKALVSSWQDKVYVVDTASFKIESEIAVGHDPEHLVVSGDKLYVANSGGLEPTFDTRISVVDLVTKATSEIDVAINLNNIVADQYGDLYVTSGGDYFKNIESNIYAVDTKTGAVKKKFDLMASSLAIDGDNLYVIGHSNLTSLSKFYVINTATESVTDNFITDKTDESIKVPYGIAVDPNTGDIFIGDANDFQNAGTVYCFGKDGKKKYSFEAGVVPAHFAFFSN